VLYCLCISCPSPSQRLDFSVDLAKFGYDQNMVDEFIVVLDNSDLTIREAHAVIDFIREEIRKAMVSDEQS